MESKVAEFAVCVMEGDEKEESLISIIAIIPALIHMLSVYPLKTKYSAKQIIEHVKH